MAFLTSRSTWSRDSAEALTCQSAHSKGETPKVGSSDRSTGGMGGGRRSAGAQISARSSVAAALQEKLKRILSRRSPR